MSGILMMIIAIVVLGGACGKPVIHLGPVGVNNNMEKFNGMGNYKEYFNIYGKRFAQKAVEIFNKI